MRRVDWGALSVGIALVLAAHVAAAEGVSPLVSVVQARSDRAGEPNVAGIGDRVVLTVRNLRNVVTSAADCRRLTLAIDDLPLPGVQGESCDLAAETVTFRVKRPESADRTWHVLLRGGSIRRAVEISIAGPSGAIVRSTVADFELEVVERSRLLLFSLLAIVGWLALIAAAFWSPALRRRSPRGGTSAPHDASRWQLAWWSGVVATAYIYLRFVTGDTEPADGANAAIFISAATAMIVWMGGRSRSSERQGDTTRGFLKDIASDFGEVSVPAVQFVVWNFVLGLLFLGTTYRRMSMPHLSTQLLGLQGLSSAIYVLFTQYAMRRRWPT